MTSQTATANVEHQRRNGLRAAVVRWELSEIQPGSDISTATVRWVLCLPCAERAFAERTLLAAQYASEPPAEACSWCGARL